jgi:Asp-tRNA(Asn)/Glu-tRNA(Gln) amidotransferase A subunit family amidase
VHVDGKRAMEEARNLTKRIQSGYPIPPLAGIPLAVTDLDGTAGMPTSCGVSQHARMDIAAEDSIQVSRLKAAGCIVVGETKTNAPAFGDTAAPKSPPFGSTGNRFTGNPWDPSRPCGGSSGGSAAAVAARMVPLATASDGGDSIRIPATLCGTFGLKVCWSVVGVSGRVSPSA